jgi:hypothetical protein
VSHVDLSGFGVHFATGTGISALSVHDVTITDVDMSNHGQHNAALNGTGSTIGSATAYGGCFLTASWLVGGWVCTHPLPSSHACGRGLDRGVLVMLHA